jgi:hypothetical protein
VEEFRQTASNDSGEIEHMRISVLIGSVALTLAATGLSACGSDNSGSSASGDYCSELKADKTFFGTLSGSNPDLSQLDQVFQKMHTLAADAPDNVSSDWKTLDGAVTTIETALSDAGLKASDLAALQNGQVPKGVDVSKLQALAPKLQSLSSTDVSKAADNISADAKKTCGVDLSAS